MGVFTQALHVRRQVKHLQRGGAVMHGMKVIGGVTFIGKDSRALITDCEFSNRQPEQKPDEIQELLRSGKFHGLLTIDGSGVPLKSEVWNCHPDCRADSFSGLHHSDCRLTTVAR
jgi:hypothetical protein